MHTSTDGVYFGIGHGAVLCEIRKISGQRSTDLLDVIDAGVAL